MVDFSKYSISYDIFAKLPDRLRYNETISEYYKNLADENVDNFSERDKLDRVSSRVKNCSSIWDLLFFEKNNVKTIEGFNRCKDKFCANCQSALALKREHQFTPIFKKFSADGNNVYHCIFTVKNCSATLLKPTIMQMFKSFSYLIRYLDGRCKIKDLDFKFLGFKSAVRSLEVTYNKEENTYHPHLHCLFVFSKNFYLDKKIENVFSYSYSHSEIRYFSLVEILFQKIWFLLNKNEKVTLENIDNLDVGFSVVFNEAKPEDYKEVFKYALKNDLNKDKCLDYERFKVYRKNLKNLRFIQGYGDCINFDFENDSLTDEDVDLFYNELRAELFDIEEPELLHESAISILEDLKKGGSYYITPGGIKKFVFEGESQDILDLFTKKFGGQK